MSFNMISKVGIESLNSKEKVFNNLYFDYNKLVKARKKSSYYIIITTSQDL